MATTMNRKSSFAIHRTAAQRGCISLGLFFIIAGIGGVLMPGLLGMHLSLLHNVIHLASGALALWSGYAENSRRAQVFCLAFGVLYGFLGIVGFLFGRPGYPGVGHMEADENLMRIIPNAFELGTSDHVFHLFVGMVFLLSAYFTMKQSNDRIGRRRDVEIRP
jgi:heme/copper-type cytochrome/quinol oxidase subunit 3